MAHLAAAAGDWLTDDAAYWKVPRDGLNDFSPESDGLKDLPMPMRVELRRDLVADVDMSCLQKLAHDSDVDAETDAPSESPESDCSLDDRALSPASCDVPPAMVTTNPWPYSLSTTPRQPSHAAAPGMFFPPGTWQGVHVPPQLHLLPLVAPPALPAAYAGAHLPPPLPPQASQVPAELPAAAGPLRSLQVDRAGGSSTVTWPVAIRKLVSKDTVLVSPAFNLLPDASASFRLMLLPKPVSSKKGGQSFKRARGSGVIQLKCDSALDGGVSGKATLYVSVGRSPPRVLEHDFDRAAVVSISMDETQEAWDFIKAAEPEAQNLTIRIDCRLHA